VDRTLQHAFVKMVESALAGRAIAADARRGEDPLPGPLPSCPCIFPREGMRKLYPPPAVPNILLVKIVDLSELASKRILQGTGQ
jgi:hypothetical protein